ncbi:MAG TPA: glycine oxidase ThiO [Gemmataceae bacterium]|nr:glycine oxidase ThiO [Gemmataceae bacterium]
MSPHPDVLIIGGGVIGMTVAYYLAREGVAVTVADKGEMGQEASWAGAGIIPPGNPERTWAAHEKLRALGSSMFPKLSAELRESTGLDNGYFVSGGIEWLEEDERLIVEAWKKEGIRAERVAGSQLQEVEPALAASVKPAYFLPDMAQVRNPRHLKALMAWCEGRVALMPRCAVQELERRRNQIVAVITDKGRLEAKQFLIAAGAWTEGLLAQVGMKAGVYPVRGQIALLNPGQPLLKRILLQGKRYLVPRSDGRVLIGSTEEDVGFNKCTTARAIQDLLAFAQSVDPGLAQAEVERCWAGLRPGSPDGLPFLGAVPGVDNLFVAAGHFRAGIQLSPATGLVLTELMLGKKPSVALHGFRLDREPIAVGQTAFRS